MLPDIVLISPRIEVCVNVCPTSERKEVCDEASTRPFDNLETPRPPLVRRGLKDVQRPVLGAIVRDIDSPVAMRLLLK
ncbi:hypothetical protein D3C71_1310540 [compost metagenome]